MTHLPEDLPGRVLAGSADAILVCDYEGALRFWNTAAERIFGHSAAEALGASLDLVIPERLRSRHWAGWGVTMQSGVTRYGKGQLLAVPALHKDGRQISIEFSIQILPGAGRPVDWVVAIVRDVSERYEREKALRLRVKSVESASPTPRPAG
ncbi:MAG: PAS domain S-box protein [Thermoanaerobaculia bacterium]